MPTGNPNAPSPYSPTKQTPVLPNQQQTWVPTKTPVPGPSAPLHLPQDNNRPGGK